MSTAWMPLYIADYRADTMHLSAIQHGAYLLMIMHYWQTGGLPEDEKQIARIACLTLQEWKKHRATLNAFFHDGWRHKRIDAERTRTGEVIEKRRAAAQQMHSKRRAQADAHAPASADAHAHANGGARHLYPQSQRSSSNKGLYSEPQAREGTRHIAAGDLIDRLIGAASSNVCHDTKGIEIVKPILDLLSSGCDLDQDVLPVIREIVPKLEKPLKTWAAGFLREAILQRRADRLQGRGKPRAEPDWDMRRKFAPKLNTLPMDWGDPRVWPDHVRAWPEMQRFVEEAGA